MGARKEHRDDEKRIAELEAELVQAQAELSRVKMFYDLRIAERDVAIEERKDAERSRDYYKAEVERWLVNWKKYQHTINVLWGVIKLALTPEQYHMYREIVGNEEA